jgi:hypothetical protein
MVGDETPTVREDDVLVMLDTVRAEITQQLKGLAEELTQSQTGDLAKHMQEHTRAAQEHTKAIQTTCDTLLKRLDEPVVPGLQGSIEEILQVVRAEKQAPQQDWKRLAALGGAVALLSGLAGWYVGHTPRLVRQQAVLMQHVNAVLVERLPALPADVKAKIQAVYKQQGFPTLEHQGGKP